MWKYCEDLCWFCSFAAKQYIPKLSKEKKQKTDIPHKPNVQNKSLAGEGLVKGQLMQLQLAAE